MKSNSPRSKRFLSASVFAAVLLATAIAASLRCIVTTKHDTAREAELDDWAHADSSPAL